MTKRKTTFQISSRSGIGRKLKGHPHPQRIKQTHEPWPEIKPVQGIMPDSKEEYWVALALWKLHIDFRFQYQLFGGRKFKGGQVVDFWVYTNPLPTPIYVQGWYFHYATAARAAQSKRNLMYIEDRLRGKANKPVEIIDLEIPTPDDTVRVVRKKLSLSRS